MKLKFDFNCDCIESKLTEEEIEELFALAQDEPLTWKETWELIRDAPKLTTKALWDDWKNANALVRGLYIMTTAPSLYIIYGLIRLIFC